MRTNNLGPSYRKAREVLATLTSYWILAIEIRILPALSFNSKSDIQAYVFVFFYWAVFT